MINKDMVDLIVIGAGPAGMNSALYASRAGLNVVIIEYGLQGGQLNNTGEIENYLGLDSTTGEELSSLMWGQVSKQENIKYQYGIVNFVHALDDGSFEVYIGTDCLKSKSVIIATGVQHKKLNVQGENELEGVGVSYCAVCDANFFKGKHVAVIGGGNSAVEEASYLADIVDEVTLIHRRNELKADKFLQDRLMSKKNVNFIWDAETVAIHGEDKVTGLEYKKDEMHYVNGFDGVFIYVGVIPNTPNLSHPEILDTDKFIINNPKTMETRVKGLFAVGDIRADSIKQIASAIGDGSIAGLQASRYVKSLI